MEHTVSGVGVLDKAVLVLAALRDGPRTLTELQQATGLPRATAHRLAVALEVHDLARRDAEGRFALGFGLTALGRAALDSFPLGDVARPALEWLRRETGESVQLYVRDGDRRVCVESLESPHGLRTIVPVGAALPLDVGSAGKVLGGKVLGGKVLGGQVLGGKVADWVADGVAESVGEREAGVASVSAPVRAAGGEVVAAVSVSGPIERTTRRPAERYGAAVQRAASMVEAAAGFR